MTLIPQNNQITLTDNYVHRLTKKEIIDSFRVNEDDYAYIVLNIIPEMENRFLKLIKRYFNYTLDELIGLDISNVEVCYKIYVQYYYPPDNKRNSSNFNITNTSISKIIYYYGRDTDTYFTMLCDLNDNELFCILQLFIVTLYQLGCFILAKQIKLGNINENYLDSQQLDEDSIYFVKYMIDHGDYDVTIKRLDLVSDINKFFRVKNLTCMNMSKIRGKDDILKIIISRIFRIIFYDVLRDFNSQNSVEESINACNSISILEDLYKYFYSKVFINNDFVDDTDSTNVEDDVEQEVEEYSISDLNEQYEYQETEEE